MSEINTEGTPLHVAGLKAQNFMRLVAVDVKIDPEAPIVDVSGANGQGKSSLIKAIFAPIAGAKGRPANTIRNGEKSADVEVDFGEFSVALRCTPSGETITIKPREGDVIKKSPQAILDKLFGVMAIDPLAFLQMKAAERTEAMLKLFPLPVDFAELAQRRKVAFDARTETNRDVARLENQLKAYADVPAQCPERVDVAEAMAERRQLEAGKAAYARAEAAVTHAANALNSANVDVARLCADLEAAEQKADAATQAVIHAKAVFDQMLPVTFDAIDARITGAQSANTGAERWEKAEEIRAELGNAKNKSNLYADKITAIDQSKKDALSEVKMPLPGLSFDETGIAFNDVPLDDCCDSEKWKICVALAMATDSRIRVIPIRQGSLLDSGSRQVLADMARERGYQVWMELVDENAETGIIIEDGRVAAKESA